MKTSAQHWFLFIAFNLVILASVAGIFMNFRNRGKLDPDGKSSKQLYKICTDSALSVGQRGEALRNLSKIDPNKAEQLIIDILQADNSDLLPHALSSTVNVKSDEIKKLLMQRLFNSSSYLERVIIGLHEQGDRSILPRIAERYEEFDNNKAAKVAALFTYNNYKEAIPLLKKRVEKCDRERHIIQSALIQRAINELKKK